MISSWVWQEVECGGYTADLAVWERLAAAEPTAVLELGCGIGRVALHLARRGHEVWAVDADPALLGRLVERARAERLAVSAVRADLPRLDLDREFGLIIAPMQLMQVLGGEARRAATLRQVAAHLGPRGRFAAAIIDPEVPTAGHGQPLPDVREIDGWVYSSLPTEVRISHGRIEVLRIRESVAPDGSLHHERHTEILDAIDPESLQVEAEATGLRPTGRLSIPAEDDYLGSTVVLAERP
jgi:SAM-dependent methyltransferase